MYLGSLFAAEADYSLRLHVKSFDRGAFVEAGLDASYATVEHQNHVSLSPHAVVGWRFPLGDVHPSGIQLATDLGLGIQAQKSFSTIRGEHESDFARGLFLEWDGGFSL